MAVRFLTLEPDPNLGRLVLDYKRRARELCGPQLYLDDPPHVTVYLAAFPESTRLLDLVGPALRAAPPPVRIVGWHAFEGDALTGLNTLVCNVHADDKSRLRQLQLQILPALAPHRLAAETEGRLATRLARLSELQRQSVAQCGFPFTGAGWEPHLTIASFRSADWPTLMAEFGADPPGGAFTCSGLAEYELDGVVPRRLGYLDFAAA